MRGLQKTANARMALTVLAFCATAVAASTAEDAFMADNEKTMDHMMKGMHVKPSGNVDADFANMMEPHHQGAIDMAILELRYGNNEQLRRIAQEIIIDQQQEIAAMRLALGRPLPPFLATPYQPNNSSGADARPQ